MSKVLIPKAYAPKIPRQFKWELAVPRLFHSLKSTLEFHQSITHNKTHYCNGGESPVAKGV